MGQTVAHTFRILQTFQGRRPRGVKQHCELPWLASSGGTGMIGQDEGSNSYGHGTVIVLVELLCKVPQ